MGNKILRLYIESFIAENWIFILILFLFLTSLLILIFQEIKNILKKT